jgi:hypothetical protein
VNQQPRFVRLDAGFQPLADGADGHTYTRDTQLGLDWMTADAGDEEINYADAEKAVAALNVNGDEGWRLPTRMEALAIVDHERHNPAVDPDLFPGIRSDWYWTSTAAAWAPSSDVWIVDFSGGNSLVYRRYDTAFVRAVRSSRQ